MQKSKVKYFNPSSPKISLDIFHWFFKFYLSKVLYLDHDLRYMMYDVIRLRLAQTEDWNR